MSSKTLGSYFSHCSLPGPQNPFSYLNGIYGDDWQEYARYETEQGSYKRGKVKLTDELKEPGMPFGPLGDRVKELCEKYHFKSEKSEKLLSWKSKK